MIVLKRLTDALRDNDPILASIRGFSINQDGQSSGLTVPNGPSQEAVVREALASGGIAAADIDYVEAHGTATSLGDPIEVHALGAVFAGREQDDALQIGSVKTNIGHLEAAAGIASVIKVVLSLQHGQIPPTLHFSEPSPQIDWERCQVKVATELSPWPDRSRRKLAGVSSFGFSGTNAHIILEAAPERESESAETAVPVDILALSAADPAALAELASRYAAVLDDDNVSLGDITGSANSGRSHLAYRLAAVAASKAQLRDQLREFAEQSGTEACITGHCFQSEPQPVTFLFSGDRTQYYGMGRGYYEYCPEFRAALDECDELLRQEIGEPLAERLFSGNPDDVWSESSGFAQPALFSLQYALARQWKAWGIEPAAVLGHGLGEYAAACVAGVFDLESGLALVAARGRLFDQGTEAHAVALGIASDALADYVDDGKLSLLAENGPQSIVVSVDGSAVDALMSRASDDGIEFIDLGEVRLPPPTGASGWAEFFAVADRVRYSSPHIAMVSSLTGRFAGAETNNGSAWAREPGAATRFWTAVQCLRDDGHGIFLEVGPNSGLVGMVRKELRDEDLGFASAVRRGRDDAGQMMESLGVLYVHGVDVAWPHVGTPGTPRIALPTYPFQRERYWWRDESAVADARERQQVWSRVVSVAQEQAAFVPIDMNVDSYADKWQCLHALTIAYISDALRSMGIFGKAGEVHTPDSLVAAGSIKPVYKMLMSRWLDYLADDGVLERVDSGFACQAPLAKPNIESLLDAAEDTLSDIEEILSYVRRCGGMLQDVLQDRESSLQTLFPAGSNETAQYLYRDWAVPRYFNQIVAAVIERFVNSHPAPRQKRILEIGAGTGATTASVVPRLDGSSVDYVFTDVSDFFLAQASKEFDSSEFMRYGLLDISKSPEEQGYGRHSFDAVIASNVLHATSNLQETIDHVLAALAPGGILVLLETTDAPHWSDISVSLIEGWQSFADDLRSDSPLLSASQWSDLLLDRGFDDVIQLPGSGSRAELLGLHVIVAHAPGDAGLATGTTDLVMSAGPERAAPVEADAGAVEVDEEKRAEFLSDLQDAAANERSAMLVDYVRDGVNRVLRRNPDKPLDRRQRLMDLGVDSLMAVELRNLLSVGLALKEKLPATLIFDYPTIEAVAGYLEERMSGDTAPTPATRDEPDPGREAMSEEDVDALSDEEVQAMLEERIGGD